jgi:hypothetical protein
MPQDENAPAQKGSILQRAFVVCVICLAVFQFSENTTDPDLWGHILYGRDFLQTGHLTRTEPYSWTAPGHEWVNHEILAEAAMALSFRALGGTGLLLLKIAAGLATFFIALSIATKRMDKKTRLAAWAFGALAVVEISFGFAARPQIFTALALAIELWLLRCIHNGKMLWVLALPPLFALWINTHGGVLVGINVLVIAAMPVFGIFREFVPKFVSQYFEAPAPWPSRISLVLLLAATSSDAALLLNPYGQKLIDWLIGSISWLRPEISEWNPALLGWDHATFFICVVLTALAFAFSRRPKQFWEIAVVVLLAVIALRSVRNTPLFCIAALAFVPPYLADALNRVRDHFRRLTELGCNPVGQKFFTTLLLIASAGSVAATLMLHKERAETMEIPRGQYPVAAVQFIQQHELRGNLLVFFDWGEMCLWELPDSRVSIDGRLDTCYPLDVINAHWKFYNAESFNPSALDLSRADFALLPSKLAGALSLTKQYGWQAVYFDNLAVVLVKKTGQYPKLAGLKLPVQGDSNATQGRAVFPTHPPTELVRSR